MNVSTGSQIEFEVHLGATDSEVTGNMAEHQGDGRSEVDEPTPRPAVNVVARGVTDIPTLTTAKTPTYAANTATMEEATPAHIATVYVAIGD